MKNQLTQRQTEILNSLTTEFVSRPELSWGQGSKAIRALLRRGLVEQKFFPATGTVPAWWGTRRTN